VGTRALGEDFAVGRDERWFEDYRAGAVYEYGFVEVGEEDLLEFARRFDPQLIHVDRDWAARGPYQGLIGSGWHSAALTMRLLADHYNDGRPITFRAANLILRRPVTPA
jgi:acyl dehydratase